MKVNTNLPVPTQADGRLDEAIQAEARRTAKALPEWMLAGLTAEAKRKGYSGAREMADEYAANIARVVHIKPGQPEHRLPYYVWAVLFDRSMEQCGEGRLSAHATESGAKDNAGRRSRVGDPAFDASINMLAAPLQASWAQYQVRIGLRVIAVCGNVFSIHH